MWSQKVREVCEVPLVTFPLGGRFSDTQESSEVLCQVVLGGIPIGLVSVFEAVRPRARTVSVRFRSYRPTVSVKRGGKTHNAPGKHNTEAEV